MRYLKLGRTGLEVSALALGTVEMGMDYGIAAPGEFGRPAEAAALQLLQQAADAGITLFDTAPGYGEAERLLGQALRHRRNCLVASKVPVPYDAKGQPIQGAELRLAVETSISRSLRALRREALDICQIHNATAGILIEGDMAEALLLARQTGKVRFLGATVYTQAEALSALQAGCFDVLQVAHNLLDQRMSALFAAAEDAGVAVITRSALLKGVLSSKAHWLPAELGRLASAAEQARRALGASWHTLPGMALRFCLSEPRVSSVLVGARTAAELAQAVEAAEAGPLPAEVLALTTDLAVADPALLNPSRWAAVA